MEKVEFVFSKLTDMSVTMQTQAERNMRLLRGKAVLNEEDKNFIFLQNEPRGPRSVEVGRTAHTRVVRRPDGAYTLTLRFDADEKYIVSALIAEVREQVKLSQEDKKKSKTKTVTKNEKDI